MPPFKPPVGRSADDTRNFDGEFTKLAIEQPIAVSDANDEKVIFCWFSVV